MLLQCMITLCLKKKFLHVMQLYNIQLKWHSFRDHVSVMASYTLNLTSGLLFAWFMYYWRSEFSIQSNMCMGHAAIFHDCAAVLKDILLLYVMQGIHFMVVCLSDSQLVIKFNIRIMSKRYHIQLPLATPNIMIFILYRCLGIHLKTKQLLQYKVWFSYFCSEIWLAAENSASYFKIWNWKG